MRTLHFGMRVADLTRSLEFYSRLGYEAIGTVPETPSGSLTMLKLPDEDYVSFELVHDPARGEVDPGGLNHFVIQVESVQTTVAELATHGIDAEPPSSPDGSDDFWTSWLTDPDGYRIELVQWPVGHAEGMTQADMSGHVARD
jgi:lactoylglutathione lyase